VPQTANGDLAFATLESGTLTEGARLTSTGNLGIGTTSPWGKLVISANNGDTNSNLFLISQSPSFATSTLFQVTHQGYVQVGGTSTTPAFTQFSVLPGVNNLNVAANLVL